MQALLELLQAVQSGYVVVHGAHVVPLRRTYPALHCRHVLLEGLHVSQLAILSLHGMHVVALMRVNPGVHAVHCDGE